MIDYLRICKCIALCVDALSDFLGWHNGQTQGTVLGMVLETIDREIWA